MSRRTGLLSVLFIGVTGFVLDNSMGIAKEPKEIDMASQQQAEIEQICVASLANNNPVPKMAGDDECGGYPLFSETYDWKEQERVRKKIRWLVDHSEEAWPALVKGVEDSRYSITMYSKYFESATNYRVGDVCRIIIIDRLTEGYYKHLPKTAHTSGQAYFFMNSPAFLRQDIAAWCKARSNKQLYQLQIELCNWAISKLPELQDIPASELQQSIDAIQKQIRLLEESKKPVATETFSRGLELRTHNKDTVPSSQKQPTQRKAKVDIHDIPAEIAPPVQPNPFSDDL